MTVSSPRKPPPRSNLRRQAAGWAAALFLFSFSARAQPPALPAWSEANQQAWWAANPTPDTWAKAADALQAQLEAAWQRSGASSFSDADFQGWMEHLEWVRLGLETSAVAGSPDLPAPAASTQTFVAMGKDESVSHLLVRKLVPRDNGPVALQNLLQLAQANRADLHEYAALGVAFCVVFDSPFPGDWPQHQIEPTTVPVGDLDVVRRFQFYVRANRDHKTELDLTQLPVESLKYLVDTKIELSELAYAQQNKIPYDHFEDAFSSIHYNEANVPGADQVYTWTGEPYTLANIEKDGGICVDQAYYAATTGKGRGIPTIFFHGQGSSGGHAWFGYLTRSGKWSLDCGRYASQNYPRGYALDPQTWQMVDDTTLARLAKGGVDPNYQPAMDAIAWARMHGGTPICQQALEQARQIMPDLGEAWQAEGNYLTRSDAPVADQKTFYNAWIAQFQSTVDLRVEGQKRLLAVLKAANDPEAESVQRDIILQNRTSDFDFGVQGSLGTIEDKFKAQDFDGAKVEFETAVRDFKDNGGGTFFYDVVRPYAMLCLKYGRPQQADDGVHFMEDRVQIDDYSILATDLHRLKSEIREAREGASAGEK